MSLEKESLVLTIKSNGKDIYQKEIKLLDYQKEILQNEDISLYYFLKDITIEMEDKLIPKLKLKKQFNKVSFVVSYLNKNLYETEISTEGISEEDVQNNEEEFYFYFEKMSKVIENKIIEEHKNIIL